MEDDSPRFGLESRVAFAGNCRAPGWVLQREASMHKNNYVGDVLRQERRGVGQSCGAKAAAELHATEPMAQLCANHSARRLS